MEEKKNNGIVTISMGLIIAILSVLCLLFATNTINLKNEINEYNNNEVKTDSKNNTEKEIQISFDDLVGVYNYEEEEKTIDIENDYKIRKSATLYLNDDGIFVYRYYGGFFPCTYYGNYVLRNNNQLLLNVIMQNNSSGADTEVEHIKLDLIVDDNGNIIDTTEVSLSYVDNKQITLIKNDSIENEYKDFIYNAIKFKGES